MQPPGGGGRTLQHPLTALEHDTRNS